MKPITKKLHFEKGRSILIVTGFDSKSDTVEAISICSKLKTKANYPLAETGLDRNTLLALSR